MYLFSWACGDTVDEIALVNNPVLLLSGFLIAGNRGILEPTLICPEEHNQFTKMEQKEVRKYKARILSEEIVWN
jgi:hypothetical protein